MQKETIELITLTISSGGILFSAIAAYAALKSAKVSSEQFKRQTDRQKILENPRIIPLTETISFPFYGIHFDWITNRNNTSNYHLDSSEFKIKFLNTGKTFALDTKISFELIGGIDSFNYHYHDELLDYQIYLLVDKFEEIALTNANDFYVNVLNVPSYYDNREFEPLRVFKTQHFNPLVQSGEYFTVCMPRYFIVLANVYAVTKNSNSPFNKPKLSMKVAYKNEYFETTEEEYIVEFVDDSSTSGLSREVTGNLIFKKNNPHQ